MNTRELAKELKIRAKLKSVPAAVSLLDTIVEIVTERLQAGENVTIARLGTFKVEQVQKKEFALYPGVAATCKPTIRFVPYYAFYQELSAQAEALDQDDRYCLIRHLPSILECMDHYYAYMDKISRRSKDGDNNFFESNLADTPEQKKIKNLTHVVLSWMSNPALPDMYAEQGIEWSDELDALCHTAYHLINCNS